ncbi:hypothetical protein EVAR_51583_1 [Eumeta japonica]|uniref:Uncharacterized protein n=1 Tax=Eumeta variegata TaxID=151549 RepID=A0A4C1YF27_EUMVA|nr:hypothetical protein EVAR_51583_1 [Eumeta japonica]
MGESWKRFITIDQQVAGAERARRTTAGVVAAPRAGAGAHRCREGIPPARRNYLELSYFRVACCPTARPLARAPRPSAVPFAFGSFMSPQVVTALAWHKRNRRARSAPERGLGALLLTIIGYFPELMMCAQSYLLD